MRTQTIQTVISAILSGILGVGLYLVSMKASNMKPTLWWLPLFLSPVIYLILKRITKNKI